MSPRISKTSRTTRSSASRTTRSRVSTARRSTISRRPTRTIESELTPSDTYAVKSTEPKRSIRISNPLKGFSSNKKSLLRRTLIWVGVFLVMLVLVDYSVQYLNYKASIAIVNGERLYRKDFYQQLEETYGTTIATNMIDEALIYQQAEKKDITISDKEIDTELTGLETQYGGKEALQKELDTRNISQEKLRHQIETTLIIEKILSKNIKITEDELKAFYDQYKDVIFTDTEVPAYEDAKEVVRARLKDQKLSSEVQTWIQELRDNSTIKNNIEEPKDYGFLLITRTFIDDVIQGEKKND